MSKLQGWNQVPNFVSFKNVILKDQILKPNLCKVALLATSSIHPSIYLHVIYLVNFHPRGISHGTSMRGKNLSHLWDSLGCLPRVKCDGKVSLWIRFWAPRGVGECEVVVGLMSKVLKLLPVLITEEISLI